MSHVWKHTRRPGQPSNLVTILVDLTALADGHGAGPTTGYPPRPQCGHKG